MMLLEKLSNIVLAEADVHFKSSTVVQFIVAYRKSMKSEQLLYADSGGYLRLLF